MTVSCARCSCEVALDQTYFSDVGEICGGCEANESAIDSARFAAGAEGTGLNGSVVIASSGSSTTSIDFGQNFLMAALVRFLLGLVGR